MDSEAKALQVIARKILAQVCSISSCERNWSIYSFVHNKVRNRLQPSHVEDLVYIYMNNRLLRHRRGPNPVQWYGIHQIHSNDESDGEAPDGDDPGGHLDIDANMADNDDIGGDAHGLIPLIQVILLPMVTIQTLEVVAGLGNTTVLVLSSMVVVATAVTILEYSTFAKERTNHILLRPYHLLMMNQEMPPQLKRLALLKICDKHDMQILLLRRILLLTRLNLLIPRVIHWISEMRARVAISIRSAIHALLNRPTRSMLRRGLRLLVSLRIR